MFDVYFVTYKSYSIDIIDNYAVISKKKHGPSITNELLKTTMKCEHKEGSNLNLLKLEMHVVAVVRSLRFSVLLYTQSLDLQAGPMTARNNNKSFTYFFQLSFPVRQCPDSISNADSKRTS